MKYYLIKGENEFSGTKIEETFLMQRTRRRLST